MHRIMLKVIVVMTLGFLLLVPRISIAMDIVPNYDPNITAQQKAILDEKIALWEDRLCCDIVLTIDFSNADLGDPFFGSPPKAVPGMELVIGTLPTGEFLTLGETDQFQEDPVSKKPTHARIRFNNNPTVPWHYGGIPVPADKYDFWTVANHEIVHACGFTVNNSKFNSNVDPVTRIFTCGSITAQLTPAEQGTHLDPGTHPGDLMEPTLGKGERRTPSQLSINMLRCKFPCEPPIPSLTQWGLIVLILGVVAAAIWSFLWRRRAVKRSMA
jgi:hypothetical protein